MNAYEYALKIEKDGEKFYRELANKSSYSGLKMIFNLLANEEVKHYDIIKNMMNNDEVDLKFFDINLNTKTTFEILLADKNKLDINLDEIKFYKEAISMEDEVKDFYLKKAQESKNKIEKQVFEKLAEEEAKHAVVLQNILEFIEEPKNFVEAAEF